MPSPYPQPPVEGQTGALENWKDLNVLEAAFHNTTPASIIAAAGGAATGGTIWMGAAPYLLDPTGTGTANSTKLVNAITAAKAGGLKVLVPMFFSGGVPVFVPLAPTDLMFDQVKDIFIEGFGQGCGFKQAQGTGGNWTNSHIPASGFADDKNGGTMPAENYWVFCDGTGAGGTVWWRNLCFNGAKPSPAPDPTTTEASWLTYGTALRASRKSHFHHVLTSGCWAGLQFDGDYDHTVCESCISQNNWHNLRFGPRQAEKDNTFYNCTFSASSNSAVSISRTGLLGGSSFYGCHFGTQPYGVYFETGVKGSGLGIEMQNTGFFECIWEGQGNFKVFCEDGDTRLDNIGFYMAQWHGIEVGDASNIHVKYCSVISNIARNATGLVTVTVDTTAGISDRDYILINGYGSQPVQGIKAGAAGLDTSLNGIYRVAGPPAGNVINLQGSTTYFAPKAAGVARAAVASGAVPTSGASGSGRGWLARVGAVRAGICVGLRGDLQITGDEVDSRDQIGKVGASGYGTAAELFWDIAQMQDSHLFDTHYTPNFSGRFTQQTSSLTVSTWRSSGGTFFLARTAGAVAQKTVVQFSGTSGAVVAAAGNREIVGVVGGTEANSLPTSPSGTFLVNGEACWVQDSGFCEVLGAGTGAATPAAAGNSLIGDTANPGKVISLIAGTGPSTAQFRAGKAINTLTATSCIMKIAL